jgi:hypothetical protein
VDAPDTLSIQQRQTVEWAATLQVRWTYYATMTFRRPQTPEDAVMKLRSWIACFQTARPFVREILYSVEPHKTGAAHIHALLATSPSPFARHCPRCDHAQNSSCHRVKLSKVDEDGEVVRYSAPHGSTKWDPEWRRLNESWFCHFGLARFRQYDAGLKFGAVAYVLKYLFKSDLMEWGYWDEATMPKDESAAECPDDECLR